MHNRLINAAMAFVFGVYIIGGYAACVYLKRKPTPPCPCCETRCPSDCKGECICGK